MSTLVERLRKIRETETTGRQQFSELTGVPKKTIEGIEQTGRSPRGDVLEAVCRVWPQYAYWLMTGHTDPPNGHVSPELEQKRKDWSGAEKAS